MAAAVARKLGISDFEAGVLPEHKADVIYKLQQQGLTGGRWPATALMFSRWPRRKLVLPWAH